MEKRWLVFPLILLIPLAMLLLARRDPVRDSVSVTFLCYTNRDTDGWNDRYTWAWFRIENRSAFMLACQQGSLDVERGGAWLRDTNRLGFQYGPIIEPGRTLMVSMIPPAHASRWRSSFLLTKMSIHSGNYWTRRYRCEAFLDSLRLDRFGFHGQPWKRKNPEPTVVTSKTISGGLEF